MTKEGLEELHKEFGELNNVKRPKAVERLALAKSLGDLSENSEYSSAMEELAFIDGRIAELEEIVKNAKTVAVKKNHKNVDVGCTVKVKSNGSVHTFYVVGEWEADPKEKKISHSSPIGKALMGKQKGDKVEVEAPVGNVLYEILDVE